MAPCGVARCQGYDGKPERGGSERASPDNSIGPDGRGSGVSQKDSAYESFGSEEYVYDDDGEDDIGQVCYERVSNLFTNCCGPYILLFVMMLMGEDVITDIARVKFLIYKLIEQ